MTAHEGEGIEQYDREEHWRCPMLGGPVTFGYCRKTNDGLPCARILECWLKTLPLVEFLKAHYSPEQLQTVFAAKRKGRLDRMLETLDETRRAQKAAEPSKPDEHAS